MRIRKFNESDIDVVDPSEDVSLFKEKFPKISGDLLRKLSTLENEYTNQTSDYKFYVLSEYDDEYGRSSTIIGYIKAVSKFHAEIKSSIKEDDLEIVTTSFYRVEEISSKDIDILIRSDEKKLNALIKLIDNAKNPY